MEPDDHHMNSIDDTEEVSFWDFCFEELFRFPVPFFDTFGNAKVQWEHHTR